MNWKIRNDPSTLNNSVKRAMVGHSLLMSNNWEMFFRYSIATGDTPIPLLPYVPGEFNTRFWDSDDRLPLTVWQAFLINLILTGFSSPDDPVDVISRFLGEGEDPYCRILITKDGPDKSVVFRFRKAKCHQYRFVGYETTGFLVQMNRYLILRGSPRIDWGEDSDEKISHDISLREWVAATNSNNRDSLLELLDCSYKEDMDS